MIHFQEVEFWLKDPGFKLAGNIGEDLEHLVIICILHGIEED